MCKYCTEDMKYEEGGAKFVKVSKSQKEQKILRKKNFTNEPDWSELKKAKQRT